jgi:hypothetical protein
LVLTAAMALAVVRQWQRADRESREAIAASERAVGVAARTSVRARVAKPKRRPRNARAEEALERITNGVRMRQAVGSGNTDKIDEVPPVGTRQSQHYLHRPGGGSRLQARGPRDLSVQPVAQCRRCLTARRRLRWSPTAWITRRSRTRC